MLCVSCVHVLCVSRVHVLRAQAVRFSALQLAVAFRRRDTAALLLAAGGDTRDAAAFLLLRLPHVTPDRTRSMLRAVHKVSATAAVPWRRSRRDCNSDSWRDLHLKS